MRRRGHPLNDCSSGIVVVVQQQQSHSLFETYDDEETSTYRLEPHTSRTSETSMSRGTTSNHNNCERTSFVNDVNDNNDDNHHYHQNDAGETTNDTIILPTTSRALNSELLEGSPSSADFRNDGGVAVEEGHPLLTKVAVNQGNEQQISKKNHVFWNVCFATLYVLSGVTQPLLMSLLKNAGIASAKCQLYMLFYYLGPASTICYVLRQSKKNKNIRCKTIMKAIMIAVIDICAQAMNYTGAGMAGPTIFAIIYSSVTIWTAIYSKLFLKRSLSKWQWFSVWIVFGGLTLTAFDTKNEVGSSAGVFEGSVLVLLGSSCHAMTYVLSEAIMTNSTDKLSIVANCAIQGIVACSVYGIWQLCYTTRHYDTEIRIPMTNAGTSIFQAVILLCLFGMSNLLHALTFFYTLKHFWGGATSAGVMKGLQAVLVFVATSVAFCGRLGGSEMCFSFEKLGSLVVVVSGVLLFAKATEWSTSSSTSTSLQHHHSSSNYSSSHQK